MPLVTNLKSRVIIRFLLACIVPGLSYTQPTPPSFYLGDVAFDYSGYNSGTFSASSAGFPDSLEWGGALGVIAQVSPDTTIGFVTAYAKVEAGLYDWFSLSVQDSGSELSPGSYTPDFPTGFTGSVYASRIDSAIFIDLLIELLADTGNLSLDSLVALLTNLPAEDIYFSVGGTIEVDSVSGSVFSGSFSGIMISADLPPHAITISNGNFILAGAGTPALRKGDVNLDQSVDVLDIVQIVNYILGWTEFNPVQFWAADYNDDLTVDVLDIVNVVGVILEGD